MNEWQPIETVPEDTIVETKVVRFGSIVPERNVGQRMKRVNGLWYFPTGEPAAIYRATHWKPD